MKFEESEEYNTTVMKESLSGLPYAIKAKVEKCSSRRDMSEKLLDIHSRGATTMISNQEDVGIKIENPLRKLKIRVKTSRPRTT